MQDAEKTMRIKSLDLARGLAVFFMILVHVLETYGLDSVYDTTIGKAVEFFGGAPAAPVFMFVMGFFLVFPKEKEFKTNLVRGLKIMALGYLLSFMRYNLPEALGITSYPYEFDLFSFVWEVDILPFAGFAIILLALIRRFLPWPRTWILLAALIGASSPLLWGIGSEIPAVDWLLGLLWGTYEEVYFPVFPWLVFPLLGMAFRYFCETEHGKLKINVKLTLIAVVILAAGIAITLTNVTFHYGDYYRSGPGAILWMSGFVLIWIYLCELVVEKIPDNRLFDLIYYWSKHVTVIYFIQWMLICWGVGLLPFEGLPIWKVLILMVIMVPLTHWVTRGWLALTLRLKIPYKL